jgi:hypothetical protein
MKNPLRPTGFSETLPHAPFSEDVINRSVDKQVGETKELPHFEPGYRLWKEAFDSGKGGIFTLSVAEVVEAMEQAIIHRAPSAPGTDNRGGNGKKS